MSEEPIIDETVQITTSEPGQSCDNACGAIEKECVEDMLIHQSAEEVASWALSVGVSCSSIEDRCDIGESPIFNYSLWGSENLCTFCSNLNHPGWLNGNRCGAKYQVRERICPCTSTPIDNPTEPIEPTEFVQVYGDGTCETLGGYKTITDAFTCELAAEFLDKKDTTVNIHQMHVWASDRPLGCTYHQFENLELWTESTGVCTSGVGCLCEITENIKEPTNSPTLTPTMEPSQTPANCDFCAGGVLNGDTVLLNRCEVSLADLPVSSCDEQAIADSIFYEKEPGKCVAETMSMTPEICDAFTNSVLTPVSCQESYDEIMWMMTMMGSTCDDPMFAHLPDTFRYAGCCSGGSTNSVISCDMTLDNVVTHVRYDGVDLEVEGPLDMWTRVKHFSFTPVPGAVLEIGGYEGASCNGCECSGLIVECSNGLATNLGDWEAIGSAMSLVGPTSGYGDVCQSTSGMFLSGQTSDAVKIWPSNGEKYAWFRVIPEPVVPRDVVLENYWPTHSYLDAAWYKCKAPCGESTIGGVAVQQTYPHLS
eukprot:TRINITY_DN8_c1_g1_i10.p1 TRINITY_DN8_c1_g1~~TRINITY_DN8_c1_g1_i10.p1  ORF type:complete len:606 (+),score=115.12 TRINITY_DN8_c1_g1_i10:210-1820(+)